MNNKDHLNKTKVGVLWSFLNQGGNQILNLLITFILARLVSPEEFGVIGMITVFTGFAIRFVDFGFSTALIYKKNVDEKDISTVFTINTIFGLGLSLIFFFAAPLIADFYQNPILNKLTKSFSIIFLVTGLSGVNKALMTKKMNFKLSTIISFVSLLLSSALAIFLAYEGYGVWAILFKILSQEVIITILYFLLFPVNQKFRFFKKSFSSMFIMGRNVAGDSVVNYWNRNADNLMIGKMIGGEALGLYSKAYSVMLLPLNNITRVISKVMFPSFSIIQDDIPQIRTIYLKATRLIAFITFPMMAGLSILSESFVLATFGKDWIEMAPLISILSVLGAFQSILSLNGVIYNSLGKSHLAFRLTLAFGVVNIIGFFIGIKLYGIIGLATVYACIGVIGTIPFFYYTGRLINISVVEMFKNLSVVTYLTAAMVGLLLLAKHFVNRLELGVYLYLGLMVLIGGISYFALAVITNCKEYNLAKNLILKK